MVPGGFLPLAFSFFSASVIYAEELLDTVLYASEPGERGLAQYGRTSTTATTTATTIRAATTTAATATTIAGATTRTTVARTTTRTTPAPPQHHPRNIPANPKHWTRKPRSVGVRSSTDWEMTLQRTSVSAILPLFAMEDSVTEGCRGEKGAQGQMR
jgi:hypothetical protein